MAVAVTYVAEWVVANWAAAAAMAATAYSSYAAAQKMKKLGSQKQTRDYKTTLKQSVAPVRRVYGKSTGGGVLSFVEEEQSTSSHQHVTVCVVTAGHKIHKLNSVWFGDDVAQSDSRVVSEQLLSTASKGAGTYEDVKRLSDTVIRVTSAELWNKNLKHGVGSNLFYVREDSSTWKPYTVSKVEPYYEQMNTGSNSNGNTSTTKYRAGVDITVQGTLPPVTEALKVGTPPYDLYEANDPQTIADVPQVLKDASQWDNSMIGKGLHYVAFKLKYDREVFPNGLPTFRFEREGALVYDPRKDVAMGGTGAHKWADDSTYEYSNNAALVILDVLSTVYQYEQEELDIGSFIDAANHCDELVNGKPRYTINGEFDFDEDFLDVIGSMVQACAGSIMMTAGKIGLRVGIYNSIADVTISDNDIISDVSIQAETSYQDKINTVNVLYSDPEQLYEQVDAPEISPAALVAEDGMKIPNSIDVSKWVTDVDQAQRLGWIALRKNRDSKTVQVSTNLSKIAAVSGKKVDFSLSAIKVNGEFITNEWEFSESDGVTLSLTKDDKSYYEEDFIYLKPTRGITSRFVRTIPQPQGLKYTQPTDSNSQGVLTWVGAAGFTYRVDIYKKDGLVYSVNTDEPIHQLASLLGEEYIARVFNVNTLGQIGQEATLLFTATAPPTSATFTWIAYAQDDHGTGITLDKTGMKFIGFAYNRPTKTPDLTDPTVFIWSNIAQMAGSPPPQQANPVWSYVDNWKSATTPSPTNAQLDAYFKTQEHRDKMDGDILILRDVTTTPYTLKAWRYLGGWTPFSDVFNGNMLTTGAITGREISSYTTITAGTGTNTAGMNGDDSGGNSANHNYRFWAGSATAANAPFRVSKTGALTASNANITGHITATSLTLSGTIPSAIDNSNITASSLGAETPSGAQTKANAAKSAAVTQAKADATKLANSAESAAKAASDPKGSAASAIVTAKSDATKLANAAAASAKAASDPKGSAAAAQSAANKHADSAAAGARAAAEKHADSVAASALSNSKSWVSSWVYPNQTKLQIKSANYRSGHAGWAIDANGNAEFNNGVFRGTLAAATGSFAGTVYAEHIVGDIVSAKAYTVGYRHVNSFVNRNAWVDYDAITILHGYNYERTLMITPTDLSRVKMDFMSLTGNRRYVWEWRIVTPDGTVIAHESEDGHISSGNPPYSLTTSLGVRSATIPKNTHGVIKIQIRCTTMAARFTWEEQHYVAQLFKNSGELA